MGSGLFAVSEIPVKNKDVWFGIINGVGNGLPACGECATDKFGRCRRI